MLFCDLARMNRDESLKMNFVGPQATGTVSQQLVDGYQNIVQFERSDPIASRWQNVPVPDGLASALLRRTTPEPFRASLETRTSARPVPECSRRDDHALRQAAADHLVLGRLSDGPPIPTASRRCNCNASSAWAPTAAPGCCAASCAAAWVAPGRRALAGLVEIDETEIPLSQQERSAHRRRWPQPPGQDADRRRR